MKKIWIILAFFMFILCGCANVVADAPVPASFEPVTPEIATEPAIVEVKLTTDNVLDYMGESRLAFTDSESTGYYIHKFLCNDEFYCVGYSEDFEALFACNHVSSICTEGTLLGGTGSYVIHAPFEPDETQMVNENLVPEKINGTITLLLKDAVIDVVADGNGRVFTLTDGSKIRQELPFSEEAVYLYSEQY